MYQKKVKVTYNLKWREYLASPNHGGGLMVGFWVLWVEKGLVEKGLGFKRHEFGMT